MLLYIDYDKISHGFILYLGVWHTKKNTVGGKDPLLPVFALVFIIVLIFSSLTPMLADDFSYCFSWADNSRIKSIIQIIPSMAAHRVVTNGRVFAHALVQAVLMLPKAVFTLLNALNALLLAVLIARYLSSRRRGLLLTVGAMMLWCFTPAFGQVFLWLDGAVNYSWGMSVFLLFLWQYIGAYLGRERRPSTARDILLLFLAVIAGGYSENGSIAAIFIALCLSALVLIRDKRLPWQLIAGIVLSIGGFIFLMSAGATQGRSAGLDISLMIRNLRDIVRDTSEQLLPLYIIYALCFTLCLAFKADRKKLVLSAVLLLAGMGSLAAFVFAAYFTGRHFCFTVVFTVLACLILLDALTDKNKLLPAQLLCAVMLVLFAFDFSLGAVDVAAVYKASLEREAVIQAALDSGESDIELEVYLPATKYSAAYDLRDLYPEPDEWPNYSLADYYGLGSITGVGYDR